VHHTILPPTASARVNPDLLFEELLEVRPGIYTLSRADMVIHSATHLFHEGEFQRGLRDLWDLDRLLRDFTSRDPSFWEALLSRAKALDLLGPLYYGLNYSKQVFLTPVPDDILSTARTWQDALRQPLMDFLFRRAFRPNQPDCLLPFTGPALQALYIRSHYLRMPLYLLIPHLARKSWMRRFATDSQEEKPVTEG
jgi:hypothetical protein